MALDLPSYTPAECPQCQAGSSPEKPGSRPGAATAGRRLDGAEAAAAEPGDAADAETRENGNLGVF